MKTTTTTTKRSIRSDHGGVPEETGRMSQSGMVRALHERQPIFPPRYGNAIISITSTALVQTQETSEEYKRF